MALQSFANFHNLAEFQSEFLWHAFSKPDNFINKEANTFKFRQTIQLFAYFWESTVEIAIFQFFSWNLCPETPPDGRDPDFWLNLNELFETLN